MAPLDSGSIANLDQNTAALRHLDARVQIKLTRHVTVFCETRFLCLKCTDEEVFFYIFLVNLVESATYLNVVIEGVTTW
jgi:hypothetical protein